MRERSKINGRQLTYRVGLVMAVVGAAVTIALLIARKQIGDFVWQLRGYPFDLGPELFFWGRRGILVAAAVCVTGALMAILARRKRPSN